MYFYMHSVVLYTGLDRKCCGMHTERTYQLDHGSRLLTERCVARVLKIHNDMLGTVRDVSV